MTAVTETPELGGVDPEYVSVEVYLAGQDGVRLSPGTEMSLDENGTWSMDLEPNADISPSNTVWARRLRGYDVSPTPQYAIVPESATPVVWDTIVVGAPGDENTPSALAAAIERITTTEGQVTAIEAEAITTKARVKAMEDTFAVAPVPQWRQVPVFIYGHSLAATAGWHTTGSHWSDRLAAHSGALSITNRAVGGSTMESTTTLLGGASAARWNPGTTKSLMIMMNVINSALNFAAPEEIRWASLKRSATLALVQAITTGYDWTATVHGFSAGWTFQSIADGRPSTTYPTGSQVYTNIAGSYGVVTVPASTVNRQMWIETIAQPAGQNPPIIVKKNGVTVFEGIIPTTAKSTYSRIMIPIGAVNTGDLIRFERAVGGGTTYFFYNGAYIEHGRNHCSMVADLEDVPSTMYPAFQNPEIILAGNAVVKEAVAEMNALVPDAASVIDLAGDESHTGLPMMWTGDTLHQNDFGQAWYAARLSQKGRLWTPWTARLHTI